MTRKIKLIALLLLLTFVASTASAFNFGFSDGKVALIQLDGVIAPESQGFGSQGITPEQVRNLNSQAKSQDVDAVIYEINSGGGAVVASKDVYRSIDAMDVPTVCRFRDVSASGAYLAALACDEIVADSMSMTGSIGVTASYLEFSELMDELGITYVDISAGESKEIGSPFRNATEADREVLTGQAEHVQEEFLQQVDDSRNLTDEQLEEISKGHPFLGTEAIELGMVDHLGGRQKSIEVAENITEKDLNPVRIRSQQGFNWLQLLTASIAEGFSTALSMDTEGNPLSLTL